MQTSKKKIPTAFNHLIQNKHSQPDFKQLSLFSAMYYATFPKLCFKKNEKSECIILLLLLLHTILNKTVQMVNVWMPLWLLNVHTKQYFSRQNAIQSLYTRPRTAFWRQKSILYYTTMYNEYHTTTILDDFFSHCCNVAKQV